MIRLNRAHNFQIHILSITLQSRIHVKKILKFMLFFFFFKFLALPPCVVPSGSGIYRDGWVREDSCPSTHPTEICPHAEPWLCSQTEHSLSPLNWGMRVWTTRLGRAGVSCKCLCIWRVPWLHVPVPERPPPSGGLLSLAFRNNFLPSFTQLLSSCS